MNIVIKVSISSVLIITSLLSVLALSGCFRAFAPATDPCTHDPKDTSVRLCTAEEIRDARDRPENTRLRNNN